MSSRRAARVRVAHGALGLLLAAGALLGACSKKAPTRGSTGAPSEAPTPEGESQPSTATGAVEGWVSLAPGVELPRLPPPTDAFPAGCPPYRGEVDAYPVRMVGDRRLTDVLVNVTDYDRGVPDRAEVRKLAIGEDCRLTPSLVTATRGDTLEVTNRSKMPFFPSLEAMPFTQALLDGESQTWQLGRGGFRRVGCRLAEPCGTSFVVTLYHPLHAATDGQGHFRIEGVPAGETVTVSAFHPLFPEPATAEVTVPAGDTLRVELTLRAPAAVVPPAAEEAAEGALEEPPPSGAAPSR